MWQIFKNKYQKLKKEDIEDAIYKLEKQEKLIEDSILEHQEEIDFLFSKGKREKSEDLKLLYAKKINSLKQDIKEGIKKGSYLLYNIRLLKQLKQAVEDKEFFASTTKISLGNLLKDQRGLASFLNQALNTKIAAEEILTNADETFMEIQQTYSGGEEIYGVSASDDEILAVFDTADEDVIKVENEKVSIEEILPLEADKSEN